VFEPNAAKVRISWCILCVDCGTVVSSSSGLTAAELVRWVVLLSVSLVYVQASVCLVLHAFDMVDSCAHCIVGMSSALPCVGVAMGGWCCVAGQPAACFPSAAAPAEGSFAELALMPPCLQKDEVQQAVRQMRGR